LKYLLASCSRGLSSGRATSKMASSEQPRERASSILRYWQRGVSKPAAKSTAAADLQAQDAAAAQIDGATEHKSGASKATGKLWNRARQHLESGALSQLSQNNNVYLKTLWQVPHVTQWWKSVAHSSHRRPERDADGNERLLSLDPSVGGGEMPNKMVVYVLPNNKPAGRIHVSLVVRVGSLAEEEHERGFAHLLEHLAFRNTKRFPIGKIYDFLRSIGASIGADANAQTSFAHTTYDFSLPPANGKDTTARLEQILNFLSDVCDHVQITQEALDSGV
jgi:hypothetical protein